MLHQSLALQSARSLSVLVSSINEAAAGAGLVGNAETDFTTQLAALSELLVVKISLAH